LILNTIFASAAIVNYNFVKYLLHSIIFLFT